MNLYIQSSFCISPVHQDTISGEPEFVETVEASNQLLLTAREPNYQDLLTTSIRRRLSRCVKMGLYAALKCIGKQDIAIGGVIVGTGLGGLIQSESFLLEMIDEEEANLSPNSFFQSLHSSLSGSIAIQTKCHSYNMTYVSRGNTFESALLDAKLHLREGTDRPILVGASDEITEKYADIANRTDFLSTQKSAAHLPFGEGAMFVLVSSSNTHQAVAIRELTTLFRAQPAEVQQNISSLLNKHNLQDRDIDMVLSGYQSDTQSLSIMPGRYLKDEVPTIHYKRYVGEYPTSTAFALWLADRIIKDEKTPTVFGTQVQSDVPIRCIMIVNQYKNNTSLLLISKS